tara:strand:+ start:939 stop:1688 length:750 start_codon:yes stop_codon:yes gene_type:complete
MKIQFQHTHKSYQADLSKPLDISITMRASSDNPTAWYVDPPKIEPVRTEQFTGSVAEGGSVNFRDIAFNPHGHGTHTECVGHIAKEVFSVNQVLNQFFFLAEVITISPQILENGDAVIFWNDIKNLRKHLDAEAIIIRTLPNTKEKLSKHYSNTNPAFVEPLAMTELVKQGIQHFLIDLPSVDREEDGGALAAHRAFWEFPETINLQRTITELIFVDEQLKDGLYLLNLQIASFENDASPSKPVLYALE